MIRVNIKYEAENGVCEKLLTRGTWFCSTERKGRSAIPEPSLRNFSRALFTYVIVGLDPTIPLVKYTSLYKGLQPDFQKG